jgi:anti-sigma regulatory factor (Ser/Thr protein kinase)
VETGSVRTDHAPVTLRVLFAASSVSIARQKLKNWMSAQGSPGECIEDARVVISELVGNSVRHAQPLPDGNILVTWRVTEPGLEVAVTDGGSPTRPHKVNAPSSALAGRGMAIVESLALKWWSEETRSRATVHALLAMS